MPAAKITIDMDRLLPAAPGALVVESVGDYVGVCLALRESRKGDAGLEITVHQHQAAAWLSSLAAAYGDKHIVVKRYTPRDALRDRWGVEIPPGITDREILQAKLLEERVVAREGQAFSDVALQHFFGETLTAKSFSPALLPALLNDYDPERWRAASRRPMIGRLLEEKLVRWQQGTGNETLRVLIVRLRTDPGSLRHDLCRYKILRGYPPGLGTKVLGEVWEVFRKARIETDDLRIALADVSEVANEVEYYLTETSGALDTEEGVHLLVDQMSGQLNGEFYFLDRILRKRPEWAMAGLIRQIEVRFRPIQDRIGSQLSALRRLIRPSFPEEPGADWPAARWLEWAAHSYMPYCSWLEIQDQHDEVAAGYAVRFADWYYKHFRALKNAEPELFGFSALYLDRERMVTDGAVTLVLIVDNLNYVHFPELSRLFYEQGFSLEASQPLFSLIPTATEVGKAALIAGRGDQVDLPTDRYPELVQAEWKPLLHGKRAAYLANIGEMQSLQKLSQQVYFLNYLPVDQTLHDDSKETGRPHAEAVRDCLTTLAASVSEFAHRFQIEDRLLVYVVSDHGSTRIGRGIINVLDKDFYKGIALDKHHRYLALTDEQMGKLPQVARAQCYVIDRTQFKTNQNYLAAREYYRFLETNEGFYVHGGLTPEEVVVPFARFSLTPVTPEAPTVRLLNSEFRYSVVSQIPLEIGNPNPFPIEAVVARLIDIDGEEVFLDSLPGKQKQAVAISTRFRKLPGSATSRDLIVRLRYEYQGRPFAPPDAVFQITMKTMMEVTDDFDL